MTTPPLRRRAGAMKISALAAVVAFATAACGGGVSGADAEEAPQAIEWEGAASDGVVSIYTWSDYFPIDLLEKFKDETGIDYRIDFFDNNETLMTKLEGTGGSGYDVVVPSDYAVKALAAKGLLSKFSALDLPNGKNIVESARSPYYDPKREYSAPFMYGTTGFAYDTGLLAPGQEPPASWKDFFTWGEPYAGKIGMLNDQFDGVNAALRAVGAAPCTTDAAELQAAQDLLLEFKANTNTISSDAVPDRLGKGDNSMAMIWNGDTHRAWLVNNDITYVYPTEGVSIFEDNWVIPSGAENKQQALTFINWMLDPKNAAEAGNYVGFDALIEGTSELLAPEMQDDPAIVPPEGATLELVEQCDLDTMNKYTQIWETFKQ